MHMVKTFLTIIALVCCIQVTRYFDARHENLAAQTMSQREQKKCYILDAGHGGEDAGAISISGVYESGINLNIVEKLCKVISFYNVDFVLTREQDVSLHDASAVTLRQKKRSDLENRVAAVEKVPYGTLISIHQNSFPDAKSHGAQVFYAQTDGSKELAMVMQHALVAGLDTDNRRQEKKIYDSVYLMNHISCRAILIECGFLSNQREDQLLQDENYQKKVSLIIGATLIKDYFDVVESIDKGN